MCTGKQFKHVMFSIYQWHNDPEKGRTFPIQPNLLERPAIYRLHVYKDSI